MPDVFDINGSFPFSLSLPPDAAWTTIVQRLDASYLVDARFELSKDGLHHRYGAFKYGAEKYGPDDFIYNATLTLAEFSIDGGLTWGVCTPQTYDHRHTATTPMPMNATPTEFDFVWNAFFDLPENFDGEGILRFTFTAASPPITITSAAFPLVTFLDSSTVFQRVEARVREPRINDYLGEGPIAPLRRGPSDFMTARGKELVRSAVRQILGVKAATQIWGGELEWEPGFGSLFWSLKHAPGDEITLEQAKGFAEMALAWEPRVQFEDAQVRYEDSEQGRTMFVLVKYHLIDSNVPENAVVLPEQQSVEVEVT